MSSFHFPSKVLNFIDTRPKDNEVKGAIKLDPELGVYLNGEHDQTGTSSTFATFDKNLSLAHFVGQAAAQLGLHGDAVEYALMFDDRRAFVSEDNKQDIQQGFLLTLSVSPANFVRYFLSRISGRGLPPHAQLALFASLCADQTFAEALTAQDGVPKLVAVVEEAADWHPFFDSNAPPLFSLMQCLLSLMERFPALVPWHHLSPQFLRKMAAFINGQSKLEQNDSRALALATMLMLAEHCPHLRECLSEEVKVEALIRHLENTDERIVLSSLAMMNALYALADRGERLAIVKTLHERPFLTAIGRVLVRERKAPLPGTGEPSPIGRELSRLQHIRFDESRALSMRIPSDQEIDYVLRQFNLDDENICPDAVRDLAEFGALVRQTPPGSLATCAILELSLASDELAANKMHLGRPSLWPQIQARLATMLVEVLAICAKKPSQSPQRQQPPFWRIVLKSDRPFHALFRVLVDLFLRTWGETKAKSISDDLLNVFSVVRDQMERAMADDPDTMEALENELLRKKYSYFGMQKIWKKEELEKEELELNSEHIQPLRDHLRPEFGRIVLQRHINYLKRGTTFQRVSGAAAPSSSGVTASPSGGNSGGEQAHWFWRLDERQQHFEHWECRLSGCKHAQLALDTHSRLAVSQIRGVVYGAELIARLGQQQQQKAHKKGQSLARCGLCLELRPSATDSAGPAELLFCAQSEAEHALWLNALRCLCWPGEALQNAAVREEIDRLVSLEVHIRLLDFGDTDSQMEEGPVGLAQVPEFPHDLAWIPA